jgi:hypothetical protein
MSKVKEVGRLCPPGRASLESVLGPTDHPLVYTMAEQKISTEGGSSDPSAGLYDQIEDLLAEIDQACEEFEGSYDESAPSLLPDLNTLTNPAAAAPAATDDPDASASDDGAEGSNEDDQSLLNAINAELSAQQPAAQGQAASPVSAADQDLAPASGDDLDELVAELATPQPKSQPAPAPATAPPSNPQPKAEPTQPVVPLKPDAAGAEPAEPPLSDSASTGSASPAALAAEPSLATRLKPMACSAGAIVLSPIAKVLDDQPRVVRDTIGWIGLATVFYAICLWSYALIFRSASKPAESVQGISLIGEPPAEQRR